MKKVSISQLKNQLSAILARLESAGSITVYDRARPVAVIYPARVANRGDDEGRLIRLERAGIIEREGMQVDSKILLSEPPNLSKRADVVALLLEERRSGR